MSCAESGTSAGPVSGVDWRVSVGHSSSSKYALLPPRPNELTVPRRGVPPAGSGHASIGHVKVSGNTASVPVKCSGATGQTCNLALTMTVTETLKGHKVIAITSRKQAHTHRKVVRVGSAHVTLTAGHDRAEKAAPEEQEMEEELLSEDIPF